VALNTKKSRHNNEVESEWILFHKNKLFHSAMKIKYNITMDLHASDMLHGRHLISITKENKIYIYTQFLTQSKGFLVFNATFNNISVITWQSVLLVEYPQ
jgi:hypothetical protein